VTPDAAPPVGASFSVPGKAILFGEHAAVYGRPALIAALGLRVRIDATVIEGPDVHLDLPALDYRDSHSWTEILAYTAEKRQQWQAYAAAPSPESFQQVKGERLAHAALIALGEAAAALPQPPPGLRIRVESAIPIGSGFGSSAAVAVGLVAAVLQVGGTPVEPSAGTLLHGVRFPGELRRLSLEAERRQHGTPSGIDHATVIQGGLVLAEKPPGEDDFVLSPIAAPAEILHNFRLYQTGTPQESTGEVVAAVRALKNRHPDRVEEALDRIEAATRDFAVELTRAHSLRGAVVPLVRQCERGLETLGVVPWEVCDIIRQIEEAGGAAKISGAGALSGPGAGSVLVYHPQPETLAEWEFLSPWSPIDAPLGDVGIRQET
jgi:mevalonate kinase